METEKIICEKIIYAFKNKHFYLSVTSNGGSVAVLSKLTLYRYEGMEDDTFLIVDGSQTDMCFYFNYYPCDEGWYCRCGNILFLMDKDLKKIIRNINKKRYQKHLEINKGLTYGIIRCSLLMNLYNEDTGKFNRNSRSPTKLTLADLPGFQKIRSQVEENLEKETLNHEISLRAGDVQMQVQPPLSLLVPIAASEDQEDSFWHFMKQCGLLKPKKEGDQKMVKERARMYLKVQLSIVQYAVLNIRFGFGSELYDGEFDPDMVRTVTPKAKELLYNNRALRGLCKRLAG